MSHTVSRSIQYRTLLKDKRVIFVGPAPNLIGKGLGKWIDEFDIVVRTNGSIFLLAEQDFRKDYGSRCDVLCVNVQFNREMRPFPLEQWKKLYGLQCLNMKTCAENALQNYNRIVLTRSLIEIVRKLQNKVVGLLMGPVVITDVLNQSPKEFFITGMDFYVTKPKEFIPKDWREYYPNYLPEKIRKRANTANIGRKDMHDIYYNTQYIYQFIKSGRIKTHDFIQELMEDILDHPELYTNKGKYG